MVSSHATLPGRPLIKPWLTQATTDDRMVLGYGTGTVQFEGTAATEVLPALLPLLDGTRSVDDIVAGMPTVPADTVHTALGLLQRHALLLDGPVFTSMPAAARSTLMFLGAVTGAPSERLSSLGTALQHVPIAVIGSSGTAREITRLLGASGFGTVESIARWTDGPLPAAAAIIAAPEAGELSMLDGLNRRAVAEKRMWIQVLPYDGNAAVVGPMFIPGETCCYECYRLRRAANVEQPAMLRLMERGTSAHPMPAALDGMLAGLVSTLVLRHFAGAEHMLVGAAYFVRLDFEIGMARHDVLRVPRCPVCSAVGNGAMPMAWSEE